MEIGPFKIDVWKGGYPVWVEITHGETTFKLRHDELRYLKFGVEDAIRDARYQLPENYREEV